MAKNSRKVMPDSEPPAGYTPPANPEAEQSVLGAILVRPQALDRVLDLLSPEDFYREAHGRIYKAMLDLYNYGQAVDLVTVTALLKERGQLDCVGGPVFIAALSEQVGFAVNADYYASLIRDKAIMRRVLDTTQEIAGSCFAPVEHLPEFLDAAEAKFYEATQVKAITKIKSVGDIGEADLAVMEKIHYAKGEAHGLYTKFHDIDAKTAGLHPGDLTILAARPSMGKTALAMNIAWNIGYREQQPVLAFSMEMPEDQLVRRLISGAAEIDGENLKRCKLTDDEWKKRYEAQTQLNNAKIFIDEQPALSALEIRARARRTKSRHGLALVVVDYLQLMAEPRGSQSRNQSVGHNSKKLKELAKELDVPVLALCQVSREIEKEKRKHYRLSDLRESGDIEQDADNVWFLWRDIDGGTIADFAIAKQRNGQTAKFQLIYVPAFTLFNSYSPKEPPLY